MRDQEKGREGEREILTNRIQDPAWVVSIQPHRYPSWFGYVNSNSFRFISVATKNVLTNPLSIQVSPWNDRKTFLASKLVTRIRPCIFHCLGLFSSFGVYKHYNSPVITRPLWDMQNILSLDTFKKCSLKAKRDTLQSICELTTIKIANCTFYLTWRHCLGSTWSIMSKMVFFFFSSIISLIVVVFTITLHKSHYSIDSISLTPLHY